MGTCGIYRITVRREASGKVPLVYIGSAVNFSRRWSEHRRGARTNKHLWASRQKYGEANVTEEIVEECDRDVALLKERETAWWEYEKANEAAGLCEVANFGPPDESNLIALNADPEFAAARDERRSQRHADPEFAEAHAERLRRQNQDPAFQERRIAALRAKYADPEFAAAHAERVREMMRRKNQDPAFREASRVASRSAKAKYYLITLSCGSLLLVYSLNAWAALNGLDQGALVNVAQGKYRQHKGHRCEGPLSEERVKELLDADVRLWTPPT